MSYYPDHLAWQQRVRKEFFDEAQFKASFGGYTYFRYPDLNNYLQTTKHPEVQQKQPRTRKQNFYFPNSGTNIHGTYKPAQFSSTTKNALLYTNGQPLVQPSTKYARRKLGLFKKTSEKTADSTVRSRKGSDCQSRTIAPVSEAPSYATKLTSPSYGTRLTDSQGRASVVSQTPKNSVFSKPSAPLSKASATLSYSPKNQEKKEEKKKDVYGRTIRQRFNEDAEAKSVRTINSQITAISKKKLSSKNVSTCAPSEITYHSRNTRSSHGVRSLASSNRLFSPLKSSEQGSELQFETQHALRRLMLLKERQRARHRRNIMEVIDNLSEGELEKVNHALVEGKTVDDQLLHKLHLQEDDNADINSQNKEERPDDAFSQIEVQAEEVEQVQEEQVDKEKDKEDDQAILIEASDYGLISKQYSTIDAYSTVSSTLNKRRGSRSTHNVIQKLQLDLASEKAARMALQKEYENMRISQGILLSQTCDQQSVAQTSQFYDQ